METIPIYESGTSDKVIRFIDLSDEKLSGHCSKQYAKRIIHAKDNGLLWGVHVTKSGKYRAIFV